MKIAITGKGGVGKTTLSAMLGHIFSASGKRVIAVDADPDANLGTALGISAENINALKPIAEMADLIEGFDISRFGSAPTKFDVNDLFPLTARYLAQLPLADVAESVRAAGVPEDKAAQFWEVTRENISTLKDLEGWWVMMRDGAEPQIDAEDSAFVSEALAMLPEGPFDGETWGQWTAAVKEKTGRKGRSLFMPLRKALTGQSHGPDMSALLPLLQVIKARN